MNAEVDKHVRNSNPESLLKYLNAHAESVQTRLRRSGSDYEIEIETALLAKWISWANWVQEKLEIENQKATNQELRSPLDPTQDTPKKQPPSTDQGGF